MFETLIQWNTKLVRWNPRTLAKWENLRTKGKTSYVWFHGVLSWGVPMFVIMTPFLYFQQYGWRWPTVGEFPVFLIVLNLILWPTAGYFFGLVMWSTLEAAYTAHRS